MRTTGAREPQRLIAVLCRCGVVGSTCAFQAYSAGPSPVTCSNSKIGDYTMKRGTDHSWEARRYKGDTALYAHCNCGIDYNCSRTEYNKEEGFITKISVFITIVQIVALVKNGIMKFLVKCSRR